MESSWIILSLVVFVRGSQAAGTNHLHHMVDLGHSKLFCLRCRPCDIPLSFR